MEGRRQEIVYMDVYLATGKGEGEIVGGGASNVFFRPNIACSLALLCNIILLSVCKIGRR